LSNGCCLAGDGDEEIEAAAGFEVVVDENKDSSSLSKGDRSHLIVWEVTTPE
jgi:hypothetical protein